MISSHRRQVTLVTQKFVSSLTSIFLRKGWISEQDIPYCRYSLQFLFGKVSFFVLLFITCAVLDCYKEALFFSIVLLSFRKRMGGWHAKHPWLCQIISIALVIFSVSVLGPQLTKLQPPTIIAINCITILISFFLPPAFPPQLHFNQEEKYANVQKKNQMLVLLSALQPILVFLFSPKILIFSSLGLLFGISSVLIEKAIQNNGKEIVK